MSASALTRRTPLGKQGRSVDSPRTGSPVGASSHRHPTDRFLDRASMAELGHLLDEHGTTEVGRHFFCIRCQKAPLEQIQHGPAAYVVDNLTWRCQTCGKAGTRWHLVNAVRFRTSALHRLNELLAP